jgi:hypothetical protein
MEDSYLVAVENHQSHCLPGIEIVAQILDQLLAPISLIEKWRVHKVNCDHGDAARLVLGNCEITEHIRRKRGGRDRSIFRNALLERGNLLLLTVLEDLGTVLWTGSEYGSRICR